MLDAHDVATLKDALIAERTRLLAEIAEYELEGQETLSDVSGENNYRDHMADQGTATFGKELDATLEGAAREMHATVVGALARIEAGTYGTCVRCGQPVGDERLAAMPAARLCIACKEWEESR